MSLPFIPAQVNPDNAPHFDGLANGRLMLPRCDRCGHVIWYPRHHCPACGGGSVTWIEASGRGRIHSFTVVRRGVGPWTDAAPYVLAYVDLEEGPRVLANIVDQDLSSMAIGLEVRAAFAGEGPAVSLRFVPA